MIDSLMNNTIQTRNQHCWSDNSALNSSNSSLNLLQEHNIFCDLLSMNLSAVSHTQREKLNAKWQCNNMFTSTLQDLNVVLQQTEKKMKFTFNKASIYFCAIRNSDTATS